MFSNFKINLRRCVTRNAALFVLAFLFLKRSLVQLTIAQSQEVSVRSLSSSLFALFILMSSASAQVVVLRSSIPMQGEYDTVFEVSAEGESQERKSDDEDESSFVLGADLLYPMDDDLSFGVSAFYGTNLEIDPEEGEMIARSGVTAFTMRDVDKYGIAKVCE